MHKLLPSSFRTIWSCTVDEFRRKPVNRAQPTPQSESTAVPQRPPVPQVQSTQLTPQPTVPADFIAPQPLSDETGLSPRSPKKSRKKLILWSLIGFLTALILTFGGLFFWYTTQLAPVDTANEDKMLVKIESGSTPDAIAQQLKDDGLIRDTTAFMLYTRFEGVQNSLQAGSYRLSPSESTQQIVAHLVSGRVDMTNVTLYPGGTLVDNSSTDENKKYDVTTALKRAGYTDEEISRGLAADYSDYNATLFQGRPASADLEGYVFGETYRVSANATVEEVLRTSFDYFWKIIQENDLVAKFETQGLTLYQGITMASIVQRESGGDDKETIAQVFYKRYRSGEQLGSDVTYQYIADKQGAARDINFDSPYNTRRYTGLPPGPIAAPGLAALLATGAPASTDYNFFLSGDDDITYFARTFAEHEANIRNHCQSKCQIL